MVAAEHACALGQPIHHEAGVISPQKVLNAMLATDAIGKKRKCDGRHWGAGKR
jgi:glycerol dehydrogenase